MNQKKLTAFVLANIAIIVIILLNSTAMNFFHGVIQAFLGGNAEIKTLLFLSALTFSGIISLMVVKTGKKIDEKKAFRYFTAMILTGIIGLTLGLVQTGFFANELNSNYPIATINENMTNWEATSLYHNHLTKGTIYFVTQILGQNFSSFDSGQPLYEIQQNPEIWAIILLVIVVLVIVFGLIHINSMLKKIELFDFFVFNIGMFGLAGVIIDGGAGSTVFLVTALFLAIYFSKNFLQTSNKTLKDFSPMLFIGVIPLALGPLYNVFSLSDNFTIPLIMVTGLGYFLWKQGTKNVKKPFNLAAGLLFLLFLPAFFGTIFNFGFGTPVFNFSKEFTKNPLDGEGNGLFIYGLPKNAEKKKIDSIVSEFGEIKESYKLEWLAYYRIVPGKEFRTNELEEKLKLELKPQTYLYVEIVVPSEKNKGFVVHWLENKNESNFLTENFFGINVLEKTDYENKTVIKTRSKLLTEWNMLAILTQIRKNSKQKIAISSLN